MGLFYHLYTIGSVVAILFGTLPLLYVYGQSGNSYIVFLAAFNCVAWIGVGILLLRQRTILSVVKQAVDAVGISQVSGSLTKVISRFVRESTRFHRAAFASRLDSAMRQVNLGQSLNRIIELAYLDFKAVSVELCLVDEETGLCSQAMLVGDPISVESQSMLAVEGKRATRIFANSESGIVAVKPVCFAGNDFGSLRVELKKGVELSMTDRHVLHLLASQAGILLVDARFTEELLRMRRSSEETTRAKTGFLANLSHEIRGPLGIILNGMELALDGLLGDINDDLRETLSMVKDSGDHLLDLVNDVLDYAKVEAGKISVNQVEIPVLPLLEDLVAVVRTQANTKGHKLILEEVSPTLGIECDKRHARQMLINFLTNAIKYTPDGGQITLAASRTKDHRVRISVKDTGIGIPKSERSKVFGAFERIENNYAMTQVGAGLGMPLTQRLAEINNGGVGFQSEENKGSIFWVVMNSVEIAEPSAKDADGEEQMTAQGHGESVLLVDLETETRGLLERYMVDQGFKVLTASSGSQVIKLLRQESIDIVVVENDLPDLPGEEMVAAIRAAPVARTIPIILLSSRAFVFDIERFLKLGVDRCLSKPVSLGELATTSRRLIDETKSLNQETTV